ncbi:MAG: 30S ribosomal protein S18 [Clostridiales bacterium]|jgi:small subunit ribosomal protein S18|nr:30S ribosomal protein S18 [Clostridiales bacterium]
MAEDNQKFSPRKRRGKPCKFCINHAEFIDYKDHKLLLGYLTERGKIIPRRVNGNCAHHQRMLTMAIKRARQIALIPYTTD